MNNPIRKFRKFFVKPKKMNATAVRNAAASSYDEETDDTKLSGAFIIVLILHIVAVVGIVAFTRIRQNRDANEPVSSAAALPKEKKAPVSPMTVAGIGSNKAAIPAGEPVEAATPVVESNPPKVIPSTGGLVHTVKANETLTKIAIAYGTTVPELVKLNELKSTGDIHIGQHLNLPEKNSMPPVPKVAERRADVKVSPPKPTVTTPVKSPVARVESGTYVIKKGDNLTQIARNHSLSYTDLIAANRGLDPKKIQPGQKVNIPKK
jgi:LysM repeat protein